VGFGMFVPDARGWIHTTLEQSEGVDSGLRSRALAHAGILGWFAGDVDDARALLEESVALARSDGDPATLATRLDVLGVVHLSFGQFDEAVAHHEEALAIAREAGDTYREMGATVNLGNVALNRHDFDRAQQLFEDAFELCVPFESLDDLGRIRTNLALVRNACGRIAEADAHIREVLPHFRELGNQAGLLYTVVVLASNAAAAGDDELACVLAGATASAAEAVHFRFEPFEQRLHDRTVAQLRERLGDERAEELFARGRKLPFDEAVELAAGWRFHG
jgi:tetratricopeptide (TPR) repeat protein